MYDKASKLFTSSINSNDFNLTGDNDDNDSSNGTDTDSSSSGDKEEESSNAGTVNDQSSSSTLTLHGCNGVVVLLAVAVGHIIFV